MLDNCHALEFKLSLDLTTTQFRLGRRPFVSPIAGKMDEPSIPSEEEVKAGNYIYVPTKKGFSASIIHLLVPEQRAMGVFSSRDVA